MNIVLIPGLSELHSEIAQWTTVRAAVIMLKTIFPDICPACQRALRPAPASVCNDCSVKLQELPSQRCNGCGGALDNILDICGECLEMGGRRWDRAVTVFPYGDYLRELIHRFKYNGVTALTPYFAQRMSDNWQRYGGSTPDIIVPIPLHWRRRLGRGYNQSGLLAEFVSRNLEIPVRRVLRRPRATQRQAMLDLGKRQANVREVFAVKRRADLTGTRILLVDDVFTTGATLDAAAGQLCKAGVQHISILTLARG